MSPRRTWEESSAGRRRWRTETGGGEKKIYCLNVVSGFGRQDTVQTQQIWLLRRVKGKG